MEGAGVTEDADSALGEVEPSVNLGFGPSSCGFGSLGGFFSDPPTDISELVLELADPTRLPREAESSISLLPGGDEDTSSLGGLTSTLTFPCPLSHPDGPVDTKIADSAFLANSDPWSGALLLYGLSVMVSGPLDSELARMNIFWWAGGGDMSTGEVCWGEWSPSAVVVAEETDERGGLGGIVCPFDSSLQTSAFFLF